MMAWGSTGPSPSVVSPQQLGVLQGHGAHPSQNQRFPGREDALRSASESRRVEPQPRGRSATPGRTARLSAQPYRNLGTTGTGMRQAGSNNMPTTSTPTPGSPRTAVPLSPRGAASSGTGASSAGAVGDVVGAFGGGPSWTASLSVLGAGAAPAGTAAADAATSGGGGGGLTSPGPSPDGAGSGPGGLAASSPGGRKLVPTLSLPSRNGAVQPSRSLSHPRAGAPGTGSGAGPASAGPPSGQGQGQGAQAVGAAAVAAATSTLLGSPRGSSLMGPGTVAAAGAGTAAALSGSHSSRSLRPSSASRRCGGGGGGGAGGGAMTGLAPSYSHMAAVAAAALGSGVTDPHGVAAAALTSGLSVGPSMLMRPRTSPEPAAVAAVAALSAGTGAYGSSATSPYAALLMDMWGSPSRPSSAAPGGPITHSGGAPSPSQQHPSYSAGSTAHGGVAGGGGGGSPRSRPVGPPHLSTFTSGRSSASTPGGLAISGDGDSPPVPPSPSLSPCPSPSPLYGAAAGAAPPLSPVPDASRSPAQHAAHAAQLRSGSANASMQGRTVVSCDGLPAGPSRLYEAITKRMEELEEDAAEGGRGGVSSSAFTGAGGSGGAAEEGLVGSGMLAMGVAGTAMRSRAGTVTGLGAGAGDAESQVAPADHGAAQAHAPPDPQFLPLIYQQHHQQHQHPHQHQPSSHPPPQSHPYPHAQPHPEEHPHQAQRLQQARRTSFNDCILGVGGLTAAAAPSATQASAGPPRPPPPSPTPYYSPLQPRERVSWNGVQGGALATANGCGAGPLRAPSPSARAGGGGGPVPPPTPTGWATQPSAPVAAAGGPSAGPGPPAGYQFPTSVAFVPHQLQSTQGQVQAGQAQLQPGGAVAASAASASPVAVAAAAGGVALAAASVAAAVTDLRNWWAASPRSASWTEGTLATAGLLLPTTSAPAPPPQQQPHSPQQQVQRMSGGSAAAASPAAVAVAGRPYVASKLGLGVSPAGPVLSPVRRSIELDCSAAPFSAGSAAPSSAFHLQPQAQYQQHHEPYHQQTHQQHHLFYQQQHHSSSTTQHIQQHIQQHPSRASSSSKPPFTAIAGPRQQYSYYISASAVGPPLEWDLSDPVAMQSSRRPPGTAPAGGPGANVPWPAAWGNGGGDSGPSRPSTARLSDRFTTAANARQRVGGGGGALRQQVWMEASAQLTASSAQQGRPQLWIQNAPRPLTEAGAWLSRVADAAPCGWADDGALCGRPPPPLQLSKGYLEGLRAGTGAVEASMELEALAAAAAARAAEQAQRVAAAAAGGASSSPAAITAKVQTWRAKEPAVGAGAGAARRAGAVRSARQGRQSSSSSEDGDSSDASEEADAETEEEEEEEASAASGRRRAQPVPRPPPLPVTRPGTSPRRSARPAVSSPSRVRVPAPKGVIAGRVALAGAGEEDEE